MKAKLIIFGVLIFNFLNIYSQNDTTIYYSGNNKPCSKNEAKTYCVVKTISTNKVEVLYYGYKRENLSILSKDVITIVNDTMLKIKVFIDDKKNMEYTRDLRKTENGDYDFKELYEDGTIKKEGKTKTKFVLHYIGEVKDYYSSGILQSTAIYDNNQMISNVIYNMDGSKYYDNVFSSVDKLPEYYEEEVGLLRYVAMNTRYPEKAKRKGISGRVFIGFVILENGTIDGVKVLKSVSPELDDEALRVVKSIEGKWSPAELDGKKVSFFYTIPINFMLN